MPDPERPPGRGCVLCGGPLRPAFAVHGYDIAECGRCMHRQLDISHLPPPSEHVRDVYGDEYFSGGGAGYPDYLAEGPMLRDRGKKYGELLRRHHPTGVRVLDIGAAAGFVLAGLGDAGWKGVGVEPNDRMAAHARDVLKLDVRTGSAEDLAQDCDAHDRDGQDRDRHERDGDGADREASRGGVEGGPFDAITLIQVVAHFVDPVAALRAAVTSLAPDGVVLIETWDRSSKTARLFKQRWHEYSPPSVIHWFTRPELDLLAAKVGLVPIARGRMIKWIGGAHAKSLVAHRSALAGKLASVIPSKLRIPYPSEDLVWKMYRRSPGRPAH